MGPIDYSINVQNPFNAALEGYQAGAAIRNDQQQQALLQQQQQLAQQQQADLAALIANPNAGPREYAAMTVKYPALREQFKQASELLSSEQQKGQLNFMTQAYAALLSDRGDVAEKLIRDRATGMRNSGLPDQEVKQTELWADMIKQSPEQARHLGGLMLAGIMGPEKFAETFGKLGAEQRAAEQAPGALRKVNADAASAEADAKTKAIAANFAHQNAVADLEKKGWDVKNIQSEIGYRKEANRIAAMNAASARTTNDLKRQELQLQVDKASQALAQSVRDKAADAESAATTIDNSLNTIERLKRNPGLNDVVGAIEGSEWYPTNWVQGGAKMLNLGNPFYTPSSGDDRADAKALIQTLGSQAFLSQAANLKGMGALSNAEGEKLQSALTNLSRQQSEKQFRANLDEAARLLTKSRETLAKRTGVPLGKPDTPAAPGARPPIEDFFKPPGN